MNAYYITICIISSPTIAAVIAAEGFACVAIGHAEGAEHGDEADAAQAGKVCAAAGGAAREVIQRVQACLVARNALTVRLLPGLVLLLIKERVPVDILLADGFLKTYN